MLWAPILNWAATIADVFGPFEHGIPIDLIYEFNLILMEQSKQPHA